ncbi:MAG: hypothetical protein GC178_12410 [Flavobacteriales bacterium]|nr:hypothetical protein [Flavobacteriales bacterium]
MHTTRRTNLILILIFASFGMLSTGFSPRQELPCLDKRFAVVVHIVRDSLGQANVTESAIQAEVDAANALWSNICVSFEICEFNYIDNFQWDTLDAVGGVEWNQMLTAYHQEYRINVFYVQHIINPPGVAGFADLGGITNTQGGGICIVKPGGALTHEMGHYWGLPHTFETGNGVELVDGSNCQTAGDGFCDTPADPYVQFNPSSQYETNCIFTAQLQDPNGDWYDPDIGNIMSYYDCACHFSYEQYWHMANTYTNNLTPNGQTMW